MDKRTAQQELLAEIKKCQFYVEEFKKIYVLYKKSKMIIDELNKIIKDGHS
jgi:hypothetical protein